MARRINLHALSTWIRITGGRSHLPLPRVPPHSQRSTLLRLLHLPLTQVVLDFFGSLHLPRRRPRLSIDIPTTCVRFDRTSDTVLSISGFSILPKVLPCVLQICLTLSSLRLSSSCPELLRIPCFRVRLSLHTCLSFYNPSRKISSSRNCNMSISFEPRPHLPNPPPLVRCHSRSPPPTVRGYLSVFLAFAWSCWSCTTSSSP